MRLDPRSSNDKRSLFERLVEFLSPGPDTRADLIETLADAESRELIAPESRIMLEGVIRMADMIAGDVMVAAPRMDLLDIDAPYDELLAVVIETSHSRFPVYEGQRENVIGILLAKDLLKLQRAPELNLRTLLRPAVFVPESKSLNELLRDFRSNRNHLAIVIDEFGNTAGLITIEDVLEEIVGEIEDEFDEIQGDQGIYTLADGSQRIAGDADIAAVNAVLGVQLPEDAFDTIGGLVAHEHGRVPRRGETVEVGGLAFSGDAHARRRGALVQGVAGAPRARRLSVSRSAGACVPARAGTASGRAGCWWRSRSARCRRSPTCAPALVAAAAVVRGRAGLHGRARRARAGGGAGLGLRRGLARRRRVVAVHQHAPLRRVAGGAGGAGGARCWLLRCRCTSPAPWRWSRAGAAACGGATRAVCRAVAAGRTGAHRGCSPAFRGSRPAMRTSTRRWRRWRRGSACWASAAVAALAGRVGVACAAASQGRLCWRWRCWVLAGRCVGPRRRTAAPAPR